MRLNGLQFQPEPLIRGEFLIGGNQRAFRFNGRHQNNAVVGIGMPFFVDGQEWELFNMIKHLCRRKEHGNPVFLKIIHNLYYRGVQFHLAKLLQLLTSQQQTINNLSETIKTLTAKVHATNI